jgi:hypothetical protein
VLRAGTETALAFRPGDLLFVGDDVLTKDAPASFLFYAGTPLRVCHREATSQLQNKRLRLLRGKTSEQPACGCDLPQVLRSTLASEQHYGLL